MSQEVFSETLEQLNTCNLCPRACNVLRSDGAVGFCGVPNRPIYVARAALHMWEEPCISGQEGSGAIFFSGCPLKCVYCQNYYIANSSTKPSKADKMVGKPITVARLSEIMLNLQGQHANNINLVTPTHYTPEIIEAVSMAREQGLRIPIVYNCSGYETVETLKRLEGIVDIYLVDFKYMEEDIAEQYSRAKDYPEVAKLALAEMVRQLKDEADFDERGMMKKGVIVRHLLLPNHLKNAKKVVQYVYETYENQVYISLMNQYTPLPQVSEIPELNRKVTKREYQSLIDYALDLGVEHGFIQEGKTAKESFIPAFDCEGV